MERLVFDGKTLLHFYSRIASFKKLVDWEDGRCGNLSGMEGDLGELEQTIINIFQEEYEDQQIKKNKEGKKETVFYYVFISIYLSFFFALRRSMPLKVQFYLMHLAKLRRKEERNTDKLLHLLLLAIYYRIVQFHLRSHGHVQAVQMQVIYCL